MDAAFRRLGVSFNDEGCSAHSKDEAVAAAIERQSRLLDDVAGRRGPGGGETCTNPRPQFWAGHVVGGNDHHTVCAIVGQPIFSDAERGRGGGACDVDGRVWTTDAGVLSELGVAHVENLEQEAPVEPALCVCSVVHGVLKGSGGAWEA